MCYQEQPNSLICSTVLCFFSPLCFISGKILSGCYSSSLPSLWYFFQLVIFCICPISFILLPQTYMGFVHLLVLISVLITSLAVAVQVSDPQDISVKQLHLSLGSVNVCTTGEQECENIFGSFLHIRKENHMFSLSCVPSKRPVTSSKVRRMDS